MAKKVLFVCATGIATSTVVTEKVVEYCKENGVKVDYQQINVSAVPSNSEGVDLIVSTTNIPYKLDVPVVNGLAIITGFGETEVLNQILSILKEGE
ncbi:PTS sugar transporter subunit IIB [Caldibacillus thermoamylovorans]|uniref:PTS sugar transporter subunit IIB n=1 Tax=Caldibacillus thermoamylovorans TaxID=35841 RepID=UPI0022DEB7AA|nr:PTS sugar transporter subunit IIB [Caldibacillus thermoamylovorans]